MKNSGARQSRATGARGYPLVIGLALLLVMRAGALSGAENDDAGWTLKELAEVALSRNPGLAAVRAGARASAEDIAIARGGRWPQVYAFGRGEYYPRRERLLLFRHGFRGNDNPFETAIVDYGLEVRLPLYTGGRIDYGITLAKARTAASRNRSRLTRQQLIFNVASGYYTALRLKQVVAAQKLALESLKESQRVAALRRAVGRIAPLDMLRFETRQSQGERDLARARTRLAQSIELLKALINVPAEVSIDVAGTLTAASGGGALDMLRSKALNQRPDLAALRQEVRARRAAVGVAEARLGPTVDLRGTYRGVTGIDDGITKDDAQMAVVLRMPLFVGGVFTARKRKAQARLKASEFRLLDAERRALAELERAVLELRAAGPRIRAARRAVGQAEESLRVEREKFRQGRGTSNDLLLAEEALLKARTGLAVALADSRLAEAARKLAVGEDAVDAEAPPAPAAGGGRGG
jgi:outer membrane protein